MTRQVCSDWLVLIGWLVSLIIVGGNKSPDIGIHRQQGRKRTFFLIDLGPYFFYQIWQLWFPLQQSLDTVSLEEIKGNRCCELGVCVGKNLSIRYLSRYRINELLWLTFDSSELYWQESGHTLRIAI